MRKAAIAAAVTAALAVAGCSASDTTTKADHHVWSASDESHFISKCGDYASESTCECALGFVEGTYPDPSRGPGVASSDVGLNVETFAQTAGQHPADTGC